MINLLQIVDTATKAAGLSDTNQDGKISLIELLQLGGWIMIPLGILFFATIYFFIERLIAIQRASKIDTNFMNIIRDHIMSGNVVAARSF